MGLVSVAGGYRWTQVKSVAGGIVAHRGQAGLFGALDLGDPAVVNDKLDHAEAQAFNLLADQRDPVGGRNGDGGVIEGGGHDGCWLDGVVAEELVQDALRLIEAGGNGAGGELAGVAGGKAGGRERALGLG